MVSFLRVMRVPFVGWIELSHEGPAAARAGWDDAKLARRRSNSAAQAYEDAPVMEKAALLNAARGATTPVP
jgi:hypothetical protein